MPKNTPFSGEERLSKGIKFQQEVRELLTQLNYKILSYSQNGLDLHVKHEKKRDKNLLPLRQVPENTIILVSADEAVANKKLTNLEEEASKKAKKFKGSPKPRSVIFLGRHIRKEKHGKALICDGRRFNFYARKAILIEILKKRHKRLEERKTGSKTTTVYTAPRPCQKHYACQVAVFVEDYSVLSDSSVDALCKKVVSYYDKLVLQAMPVHVEITLYCLFMSSPDLQNRLAGIFKGASTRQVVLKKPKKGKPILEFETPGWSLGGDTA